MRSLAPALLLMIAAPAEAASPAGPPLGRYGFDPASCRSGDIFATITDKRIDLPVLSCTGLRIDGPVAAGNLTRWTVRATSCIAEGQSRGRAMTFQLERGPAGLRLVWPNGDKGGWLTRCEGGGR